MEKIVVSIGINVKMACHKVASLKNNGFQWWTGDGKCPCEWEEWCYLSHRCWLAMMGFEDVQLSSGLQCWVFNNAYGTFAVFSVLVWSKLQPPGLRFGKHPQLPSESKKYLDASNGCVLGDPDQWTDWVNIDWLLKIRVWGTCPTGVL